MACGSDGQRFINARRGDRKKHVFYTFGIIVAHVSETRQRRNNKNFPFIVITTMSNWRHDRFINRPPIKQTIAIATGNFSVI